MSFVRGLVAGNQQQAKHGKQFRQAELVSLLFRRHQTADQVVLRFAPPLLDDVHKILVQLVAGFRDQAPLFLGNVRLKAARPVAGPDLELRPVLRRHPQQFGNDDHRQRRGDRLHEVEAGRIVDPVEQVVGDRTDASCQALDNRRREGAADQRPQPRVDRRVAEQHARLVGKVVRFVDVTGVAAFAAVV